MRRRTDHGRSTLQFGALKFRLVHYSTYSNSSNTPTRISSDRTRNDSHNFVSNSSVQSWPFKLSSSDGEGPGARRTSPHGRHYTSDHQLRMACGWSPGNSSTQTSTFNVNATSSMNGLTGQIGMLCTYRSSVIGAEISEIWI